MTLRRSIREDWKIVAVFIIIMALVSIIANLRYTGSDVIREGNKKFKGRELLLLIMVFSDPRQNLSRQEIRQTWARVVPSPMEVMFVVGTKNLQSQQFETLVKENDCYNDLVFLHNVSDSYLTLTTKVLETLIWANKNVLFQYLMKADEDTLINLNSFPDALAKVPRERLYWGYFRGKSPILSEGKWKETNYFLRDTYYLPYAKGGGYVLSNDLVDYIAYNSDFLTKYNNEDATMGTWLSPLEINRLHDVRFHIWDDWCGCNNSFLATHQPSPTERKAMYHRLQETGKLCDSETPCLQEYKYDWTVPPIKCCHKNN